MNFTETYLREAHKHCTSHRAEIEASTLCGCFYCLETFKPGDIELWLPEGEGTALCAKCCIDSVIGDASSLPVCDPPFLDAMHEFWFERTVKIGPLGNVVPVREKTPLLRFWRRLLKRESA